MNTPGGLACPRVHDVLQEAAESPEYTSLVAEYSAKLAARGIVAPNGTEILRLNDCALSRACNGQAVPAAFTVQGIDLLATARSELGVVEMNYKNAGPLCVGKIIQDILSLVEGFVSKGSPRFALWSGHDITLAPLLAAFGQMTHWPHYASMISIELYSNPSDGGSLHLRMIHDGTLLEVCPGQEMCPLEEFRRMVRDLIPSEAACVAESSPAGPERPPSGGAQGPGMAMSLFVVVCFIMLGVGAMCGSVGHYWYQKRKTGDYSPLFSIQNGLGDLLQKANHVPGQAEVLQGL
eukprot:scaffold2063_cov401-Prasinococcus_capsulatus_cf.AAC.9